MHTRRIGPWPVGPVGLGGAGLTFGDLSDDESIAVIHAALDSGVTLIDTALAYTRTDHPSHNEALITTALATHPLGEQVLVVTKGGHYRDGEGRFPVDGRPTTLRAHVELSLRHLRRERLPLYLLHRVDPAVPLVESVGALAELREEGKLELLGLSNVDLSQVRLAQSVTELAAVQNPLSLFDRRNVGLARTLSFEGVAFLAYSPLGGPSRRSSIGEAFPGAVAVAARHEVSVQQVALAWVLQVAPGVVPVVGSTRPQSIDASVAAASVALKDADVQALDA